MANTHTQATPEQVVASLRSALSCALDNLPDVAGDPSFGDNATAECCADIAALRQLLATDHGECVNIQAYLV